MQADWLVNSFKGFDPDNLDFNLAGNWPIGVKVVCYLLVFALVLGLGMYFHVFEMEKRMNTVIASEAGLKQQIQIKSAQIANLEELTKQKQDVEERFIELLKQLPTEKEVPGLLEDISSLGKSSGLEIEKIQLAAEIKKEYYVELPINIIVTGTYHQLGQFVSGVAGVSRIVTLHDYTITPKNNRLSMNINAKTYRYDDES